MANSVSQVYLVFRSGTWSRPFSQRLAHGDCWYPRPRCPHPCRDRSRAVNWTGPCQDQAARTCIFEHNEKMVQSHGSFDLYFVIFPSSLTVRLQIINSNIYRICIGETLPVLLGGTGGCDWIWKPGVGDGSDIVPKGSGNYVPQSTKSIDLN